MTRNILTGEDALTALDAGAEEKVKNEFTRLKSNSSFIVKVPGLNVISAYVYGNFENPKIYSFVAEEESKKTDKGFPVEDLTPFDKAYVHYKDQSDDWQDEMAAKANVYRAEQKFTFGFYDLDGVGDKGNPEVKPIMVEFTRNQARVIRDAIVKNEKYLDKLAFTLSKQGTGRETVVSLTVIPMIDELSEKQRENFDKSPDEFDAKNFEGLYYVADEEEQITRLIEAGFDVSLIGLEAPKKAKEDEGEDAEEFGF